MQYNLLNEEWIPVLYHKGEWKRVGIIKALQEAGLIRQIAASNPMDRVAVLRFLLAILYWCQGNPPDDPADLPQDTFPAGWFDKLEEHRVCFELLGDGKRFYQDTTARRKRTVHDLFQEIPTGNTHNHLCHATDESEQQGICLACCALGLIRLPVFTLTGGRAGSNQPHLYACINGTPPIYVISLGKSLFNTLTENWKISEILGEPSWIRTVTEFDPAEIVPLITGLTLMPRRVNLQDPAESLEPCFNCGSKQKSLVHSMDFQSTFKCSEMNWNDIHIGYYTDKEELKPCKSYDPTSPSSFRVNRGWVDWIPKLLEAGKLTTRSIVVGLSTDKKGTLPKDVWERIIEVPAPTSIPEEQPEIITKWRQEGGRLEWRSSRSKELGSATIISIRPHVEDQVSRQISDLLTADEEKWIRVSEEYAPLMTAVARTLSPGYTSKAYDRRNYVSRLRPDMKPKNKTEKASLDKGAKE